MLVVDDMAPYRTRKVRILNGAHTAMTPVAYLYGIDTVAEAIEHEEVGAYVKSLIYDEIIPTLDLLRSRGIEFFCRRGIRKIPEPLCAALLDEHFP